MTSKFNKFKESIKAASLSAELNQAIDEFSPNLISEYEVSLSKQNYDCIESFTSAMYDLFRSQEYAEFCRPNADRLGISPSLNDAICTSFDFHIDQQGNPKLIEVNTNAAFLLLGSYLYTSGGTDKLAFNFNHKSFVEMVLHDFELFNQGKNKGLKAAIIDENPKDQRLYAEFLLARDWLRSSSLSCDILDYRESTANYNYIYNRWTDFYLSLPESQALRETYQQRRACLSPSPWHYILMADKQRLIDWSNPIFYEQVLKPVIGTARAELIRRVVPKSIDLSPETADQIWSSRKNLFIKPKTSFGSKQTYRAGSMSRKLFDNLIDKSFIAQEFVPPSEIDFIAGDNKDTMKYDLRIYTYTGKIQMALARLYQGQVTNAQTPRGGFATVNIT